jgi:GT2 family glycosyltransferase
LKRCLETLIDQQFVNLQLIVADSSENNETKRIGEQYKQEFSSLIYIKHNKIGASAARNIISKSCKANLLIYLDDDVYLTKDCLNKLVHYFMELKQRENYILAVAVEFPNGLSLPGKLSRDGIGSPVAVDEADYLISALLLLPRRIFTRIFWNERLLHGYDDIFYCLNCKRAGFKLAFFNRVVATHDKEYATRERASMVPEISYKVYTMLYKHIIVSPSILSFLILETYGFIRNLLWYLQPHISNPSLIFQMVVSSVVRWFRGHYWFLRDIRDLISKN